MSVIFADTNCDLEKSQVKKLNINLVNLESDNDVSAFKKAFQPYLDESEDIIYLSTNFKNVKKNYEEALKYFGNLYENRVIKHIDLNSCSVSAGLIVYEVGLMYKRGCTDIEITNFVNSFKDEVFGFLITQNKEFLVKNCGNLDKININSTSNLINPIILVNKSKFEIVDKVQGKKKAIGNIVDLINGYSVNVADYPLIIGFGDDITNAEYLKKSIISKFGEETVVMLQKFSQDNEKKFDNKSLYVAFYSKKLRGKSI